MIHKIKRDEISTSTVKLEISEGKNENSQGGDGEIMTYEIVYEFMGTKKKIVPVDKGLER